MEILFILICLYVIFWQACLLSAAIWGAPTVYADQDAILDALKAAKLKKDALVVDLGCGDGRSLILASKYFGARGVGVERSPYCWLVSNFKVFFSGQRKNIKILFGNFDVANEYLAKADVVYLYLFEKLLRDQEEWIFNTINSDTTIVSLCFQFSVNKPIKIVSTVNLKQHTNIYLYKG